MRLLFNLSGEHPDLPSAEIFAVLEGEGIGYRSYSENKKNRILILDVDTQNPSFINRLAMTKKVGEFVGVSKDMSKLAQKIYGRISPGTFAVESESHSSREKLGEEIWKLGFNVDLLNPDSQILCFMDDLEGYSIAIETPIERDFNERKPHKRPCFHPTSIDPKIARVLVNLARVNKNSTVLDPFCGTGGVLIEAGLMGMKLSGRDVDPGMVECCATNLKHYGLEGDIGVGDAMDLGRMAGNVDAIVTDPPYGRSSFMTDRNLEKFYGTFLSSASGVMDPGKYLVMITPGSYDLDAKEFEVDNTYSLYVHKSLTRHILVLKRK
jgi:tRNA (guanine10-N2)-dimethyltransferase